MPHTQCWMVSGNHDSKCANSNSTLIRGNYLQFSYYLLEVPNFPTLRVKQTLLFQYVLPFYVSELTVVCFSPISRIAFTMPVSHRRLLLIMFIAEFQ